MKEDEVGGHLNSPSMIHIENTGKDSSINVYPNSRTLNRLKSMDGDIFYFLFYKKITVSFKSKVFFWVGWKKAEA